MNKVHNSFLQFSLLLFSVCATAAERAPARTHYGQPDMQGIWFYGNSTPFEREERLGNQQSYSDSEALELLAALEEAENRKMAPLAISRSAPETGAAIAQEADHNFATSRLNPIVIDGEYRTSQIISPSNGRLPFRDGGRDIFQDWLAEGHGGFDGPEIRPASERCAGPNGGPMAPMVSWFYNANMQIVQTQNYVMILSEMNHDARIIRLTDKRPETEHRKWMGNSIGYWDGNTLIVDTKGFRPEQSWFAFLMSEQLEVREYFTLINNNEILYRYTFTDSKLYTESVTVEKTISRRASGDLIYEYACHEGNYSMPSILAGARRQELDR